MAKSLYREEGILLRQNLRQARQDSGLSQVELGQALERPQSWVSQVERGVRRLDLVELADYCQALGLDLPQFETTQLNQLREKPIRRTRSSFKA